MAISSSLLITIPDKTEFFFKIRKKTVILHIKLYRNIHSGDYRKPSFHDVYNKIQFKTTCLNNMPKYSLAKNTLPIQLEVMLDICFGLVFNSLV